MKNIAKVLQRKVTSLEMIEEQIETVNRELDGLNDDLLAHVEAREIIQRAAAMTQEALGTRLSEIVSQALGLVFDYMNLGFSVQFVTRRNSTECDMFITEDGGEYDPLGSCGFGAADVASFALRVAMWSMNRTENFMVFDEPFRNLDDDQMVQAALLLSTLSEELGIQMVVVTHKEALKANAGKIYRVTKMDGVSRAVVEKTAKQLN